jgi:glycosyltransferase involved in cell wall biosynthesis
VKQLERVRVIFAGEGNLVEIIKNECSKCPSKFVYLGRIPYNQVLEFGQGVHVHLQLREPNPRNQKYICGSKLLQAIMCGKPVLVHRGTSTAVKVLNANCGIVVDAHNVEEIRRAILCLKENKAIYEKMGINARNAYDKIYGWQIMRQRILDLYSEILQNYSD